MVDTKRFVTIPQFEDIYQISQVGGQRNKDILLKTAWMRKSWDAMSTIIILHNPYTGQRNDWVVDNAFRFWSKLSRRDFNKDTKVLRYFLEEIKVRKIKIPKPLCAVFIKFLADIANAVNPAPQLEEEQPSATEDIERQKAALKSSIEQGPSNLETRLAERREQLSKFDVAESKDETGVFLPVLLLGLGIFLLSR